MNDSIRLILSSDKKHKEKVTILSQQIINKQDLMVPLIKLLQTGSDVEKGTAAEILKFVSKEKPDFILPFIDIVIEKIDDNAPRVKWGCPETIGNIAKSYPQKVDKAIPKLFENLKDKSTVIRWCAAYALTEIAKYNSEKQIRLMKEFKEIIKDEKNNGVKNLFIKAIKFIEKNYN